MTSMTRIKVVAVSVFAAAASLGTVAAPTAGHAALGQATQRSARAVAVQAQELGICIPCLEVCGPVCFVNGPAAADVARRD